MSEDCRCDGVVENRFGRLRILHDYANKLHTLGPRCTLSRLEFTAPNSHEALALYINNYTTEHHL